MQMRSIIVVVVGRSGISHIICHIICRYTELLFWPGCGGGGAGTGSTTPTDRSRGTCSATTVHGSRLASRSRSLSQGQASEMKLILYRFTAKRVSLFCHNRFFHQNWLIRIITIIFLISFYVNYNLALLNT